MSPHFIDRPAAWPTARNHAKCQIHELLGHSDFLACNLTRASDQSTTSLDLSIGMDWSPLYLMMISR